MKIIIANWKSHPETIEEARELFEAEVLAAGQNPNAQTVICPPDKFLEELHDFLKTINYKLKTILGAQDVFWDKEKPSANISYVLVGHSIQRYQFRNTDEVVNQKLKKALEGGITPVLLVGEKEGENRGDVLKNQLEKDLAGLSADQIFKILFCYEPVWAISTNVGGHPDTPENAVKAVKFIQQYLFKNYNLSPGPHLYGGSVNETNIRDFLNCPEINGAIVGAASLRSDEFANILNIVNKY